MSTARLFLEGAREFLNGNAVSGVIEFLADLTSRPSLASGTKECLGLR